MKNVAIIVIFLLAVFASLPALAGTVVLYDNTTSITGTEPGSSWQIAPCCGVSYVVTDSFTLLQNATVTGVNFDVWVQTGNELLSLDWRIQGTSVDVSGYPSDSPGGGLTQTGLIGSVPGYDDLGENISIPSLSLDAGAYSLSLSSAFPWTYWDLSNGPSTATEAYEGVIPSESFQILGEEQSEEQTVTPEPSSFLLLGSGLVGLAGMLRRKLAR